MGKPTTYVKCYKIDADVGVTDIGFRQGVQCDFIGEDGLCDLVCAEHTHDPFPLEYTVVRSRGEETYSEVKVKHRQCVFKSEFKY